MSSNSSRSLASQSPCSGAEEVRFGDGGELGVELGVPLLARLQGTAAFEAVTRVLSNRREHREPRTKAPVLLLHQAAFDERREEIHRIFCVHALAHPLCCVQGEAGAEYREPEQKVPFWVSQQLGTPVDGGSKRALAFGTVSRTPDEDRQCPAQPFGQSRRREHAKPGGGKLQRERHAVECRDDRGDIGCVGVSELELRLHRAGSLDEQFDGDRGRQRCQWEALFPVDAKRDSARGEHRN